MSRKDNEINSLLKALAQRPIAYHRIYAQIAGSVTAGLMLSQLVYWWYAVDEREFFKTDEDFCLELAMGLYELKTAKSKLKRLGIVDYKRKGMPCRTYYKIDKTALLAQISSCGKNQQPVMGITTDKSVEKSRTITDNITETTAEKDNDSSQIVLSKADAQERAYQLLTLFHIHPKVAKSIVYEKLTPLQSIEEAVKNGLAKQKHAELTGGKFVLKPGYIVQALNQALREGKVVGPTKKSQELSKQLKRKRQIKEYKPLTQKEFEKEKNRQLAVLATG